MVAQVEQSLLLVVQLGPQIKEERYYYIILFVLSFCDSCALSIQGANSTHRAKNYPRSICLILIGISDVNRKNIRQKRPDSFVLAIFPQPGGHLKHK